MSTAMFGASVASPRVNVVARVSTSRDTTEGTRTKRRVAAVALPTQGRALTGASKLTRAAATPRVFASCHAAAGRGRPLPVFAIDAAQPFDFEAKQATNLEKKRRQERKLKIGIVGFGNFGQFLAKRFIANGHDVIATSRGDYGDLAKELGVGYCRDPDDFCEMHPDVVIFWQGAVDD